MLSPLLLIPVFFAQVTAANLPDALQAVERGDEVTVPPAVGSMAVEAMRAQPNMWPEDLARHLQVAIKGQAHDRLTPVLARLIKAADGPGYEAALRAVPALPRRERSALIAAVGRAAATSPTLVNACLFDDEDVAKGALALVLPMSTPADVLNLLRALIDGERTTRTVWALQLFAEGPPSLELFEGLLQLEPRLPPLLLSSTLSGFVGRQPDLAALVLDGVRQHPTRALLAALTAVPPDQWEDAVIAVMALIETLSATEPTALSPDERELLIAAIETAGDLRAPPLLPLLPTLCRRTAPAPIRLAAVRALADLAARDRAIIDLLLSLLDEADEVGAIAYASLCKRSGVTLPHRSSVWREWRSHADLPQMTPEYHSERLRAERNSVHRARLAALRRARD